MGFSVKYQWETATRTTTTLTDSLAVVIWLSKVFRRGESQQQLAAERASVPLVRTDRAGWGPLEPMMDC